MGIGDRRELVLMCVVDNKLVTFEDRRSEHHSFHSNFSYTEDGDVDGLEIAHITLIDKNTQASLERTFKVWRQRARFCLG
jgi:hypothetical protein